MLLDNIELSSTVVPAESFVVVAEDLLKPFVFSQVETFPRLNAEEGLDYIFYRGVVVFTLSKGKRKSGSLHLFFHLLGFKVNTEVFGKTRLDNFFVETVVEDGVYILEGAFAVTK